MIIEIFEVELYFRIDIKRCLLLKVLYSFYYELYL